MSWYVRAVGTSVYLTQRNAGVPVFHNYFAVDHDAVSVAKFASQEDAESVAGQASTEDWTTWEATDEAPPWTWDQGRPSASETSATPP